MITPQELMEPSNLDRVIEKYQKTELHIGSGEEASPWILLPGDETNGVWIRYLAFDLVAGTCANILRVEPGGQTGRHRHRGPVSGYVLKGSWRYLEYDWVARPGDFVLELPGKEHSLVCDDPEGMETVFWLNGSVETLNENNEIIMIADVFWHLATYIEYCEQNNVPINNRLII